MLIIAGDLREKKQCEAIVFETINAFKELDILCNHVGIAKRQIRVNAIAPGRIWTPLIPASFSSDENALHGANLFNRMAQPFVYLASDDFRHVTGQVLHVDGGESTHS